jgi:hypothetical protein
MALACLSTTLQRYKKYLNYANISAPFFYHFCRNNDKNILIPSTILKLFVSLQSKKRKRTMSPVFRLNKIKKLVEKYSDKFKEQFRQHVGKRIDD